MPETPGPTTFDTFILAQAEKLRKDDRPPATLKDWQSRREKLRAALFTAMGPFPEKPCPLEPRLLGTLKRPGYRIEKLIFQSRPDVWVTASAYVPEKVKGRVPAVLVVHGHWRGARRDPTVQARCLGLVHLGFFVLAVDAFGSGERFTTPAPGTYHGALYGSPLWPAGQTLLGMQVYDNRRAVDYLLTRPEVDGKKLGITGASGGGNQSMYAGALDERIGCVVPVCSVGTYQAYLKAACCVCEVLPGALTFTEEGDVLGLVAPRALMVINATQDSFQFSVGEARKSLERASAIFKLHNQADRVRHATFESRHDYNQPMREAMYGWMTRWLKGEGEGKPIAEPKHTVESAQDLACFPDLKDRPKGFLFPASFAHREAQEHLKKLAGLKPMHAEDWDSTAVHLRSRLRTLLGRLPEEIKPDAKIDRATTDNQVRTVPVTLAVEPGLAISATLRFRTGIRGRLPACVLLHLDGRESALKHPLAGALVEKGWQVTAPDLRATGAAQPARDRVGGAPDHTSAQHGLWVGRPLLGQWLVDVRAILDWLALQPGLRKDRLAVVGLGQAGVVALCAGGLLDDRVYSLAAIDPLVSFATSQPYAAGTRMGLLVPGLLRLADVPHLAALAAPRSLQIIGGLGPDGAPLKEKALGEAFAFTTAVYKAAKAEKKWAITESRKPEEIVEGLGQ